MPNSENMTVDEIIMDQVNWWRDNHFSPRSAVAALGFPGHDHDYDYLTWGDIIRIARTSYVEIVPSV